MTRAIPFTSIWLGLVLWVLVGGSLLAGASWLLYQDYLFANYGKPIMGTVDRKFMRETQGKHGPVYTPCLDYEFQVGQMTAHCESTVQNGTYESVTEGDPLPIIYLPEKITDNRINLPAENQRVQLITFGLVTASLVVFVGGLFILRYYLRQNKINRYLLSNGLSCQGLVSEVKFNLVGKAQTKQYYLVFTFRDNQGRERAGTTWPLKRGEESLWKESSPIQVYFDPNNSERFTVDLHPMQR